MSIEQTHTQKIDILKNVSAVFVHMMKVNGVQVEKGTYFNPSLQNHCDHFVNQKCWRVELCFVDQWFDL